MAFTHLHVHTAYSQFDGLAKAEDLFRKASEMGQPGLAITDRGTMAGVPEFLDAASKYPDVKPVIGCEFYLTEGSLADHSGRNYHLILLAKNKEGYRNLLRLCSVAGTEGLFNGKPHIDHDTLSSHRDGLIALSACIGGEIPQAILEGDMEKAKEIVRWYKELYGDDFYLEVSIHESRKSHYKSDLLHLQMKANNAIFSLGQIYGVKVVATNDVHMVSFSDWEAHEVLLCCNTGSKIIDDKRFTYTGEEYLCSEEAMLDKFADHQEAVDNTSEVLDKIERFDIRMEPQLPELPLPDGYDTSEDYLRFLAFKGLESRAAATCNPDWGARGETERLEFELEAIIRRGYAGSILLIWDIVRTVKEKGYVVGPGRGPATASFLLYVLGITDVDPLEIFLLFERFITTIPSPLPDIRLDFDEEGILAAYRYLQERYGEDHVARMAMYAKRSSKTALEDTFQAFGLSIDKDAADSGHCAFDIAESIQGTICSTGIHSSAVLLSKGPLSNYVPLQTVKDDDTGLTDITSMYDGYHATDCGPVKLDFLSIRELGVFRSLPEGMAFPDTFDDPEVYKIFAEGMTEGIPLFDSEGMRQWLFRIKPEKLEELMMICALYRPGDMHYLELFDDNKKRMKLGKAVHSPFGKFSEQHDFLHEILESTYGIPVYQEQIMFMARLFGMTQQDTDKFCEAVRGKNKDLLESYTVQIRSALGESIQNDDVAQYVCQLFIESARTAALKSHYASIAAMAYRLAWYRTHFPKEAESAYTNILSR